MREILIIVLLIGQDSPFSTKKKPAKPEPKKPAAPVVRSSPAKPPKTKEAVASALAYLVSKQGADGSFPCSLSMINGQFVSTAFCGLALLASGQHAGPASKAAYFIRDNFPALLKLPTKKDSQSNWGVMIGTVYLAEYYAKTKDASVKDCLQNVVDAIMKRMEPTGGFNHEPGIPCPLNYSEMEIMSNWALTGVVIAKKEGLKVNEAAIPRAIQYIKECVSSGGLGYAARPREREAMEPGRTGGAIWIFAMLGLTQDPAYGGMVQYLRSNIKDSTNGHGSILMGCLGSAVGSRQLGSAEWDQFVAEIFPRLINHQEADGSFRPMKGTGLGAIGRDEQAGPVYRTGISALVMQLDLGNLKHFGQCH